MRNRRKKIFFIFLFLSLIFPLITFSQVDDLKQKIKEYQDQIKELERQIKIYEENIRIKRKEATTLKNEISILDNKINKTKIEIAKKEKEIKKVGLEIEQIQKQIKNKNLEISDLKEKIKKFIKKIYQSDNKNYFHIVFSSNYLSDYFSLIQTNLKIQDQLQGILKETEELKRGLENEERELKEKKTELEKLKRELSSKKNELEEDRRMKAYLLKETQGAEWKFQTLLAQARAEMQEAEREISRLEKEIRKKLAEEKEKQWQELEALGVVVFSWPVPNEGITATFHDPDYPFKKWLGEHSGIDIRADYKTPIRASASGYVGRAKYGGMGYSYIMLIHPNGFSTVYGHVSEIYVEEGQYVKRGEIIGRTGGIPGTPGAGRFSTGPHLHFEIRKDGIPVNPLNYLP